MKPNLIQVWSSRRINTHWANTGNSDSFMWHPSKNRKSKPICLKHQISALGSEFHQGRRGDNTVLMTRSAGSWRRGLNIKRPHMTGNRTAGQKKARQPSCCRVTRSQRRKLAGQRAARRRMSLMCLERFEWQERSGNEYKQVQRLPGLVWWEQKETCSQALSCHLRTRWESGRHVKIWLPNKEPSGRL